MPKKAETEKIDIQDLYKDIQDIETNIIQIKETAFKRAISILKNTVKEYQEHAKRNNRDNKQIVLFLEDLKPHVPQRKMKHFDYLVEVIHDLFVEVSKLTYFREDENQVYCQHRICSQAYIHLLQEMPKVLEPEVWDILFHLNEELCKYKNLD